MCNEVQPDLDAHANHLRAKGVATDNTTVRIACKIIADLMQGRIHSIKVDDRWWQLLHTDINGVDTVYELLVDCVENNAISFADEYETGTSMFVRLQCHILPYNVKAVDLCNKMVIEHCCAAADFPVDWYLHNEVSYMLANVTDINWGTKREY
jgi:hypothetical protein